MTLQYAEEYEDTDDLLDVIDIEEDDDDDDEESYGFEDFDDDDDEEFGESEGFDDDDESLAELRFRRSRGRRRFPRFRKRRFTTTHRRPRSFQPVRSIRRAVVRTPSGTAQIRLPKAVATRSSVNARLKEIKQEIARNTKAIKKVDMTLEKNTSIVDKKVNAVRSDQRRSNKKMKDSLQMAMMMPLLMQSKPKLDTMTVEVVGSDNDSPVDLKVTEQKYQSGNNNLLPLMMMMGSNGDSSNMMMMALVLSGSLGGNKS